MKTKYKYRIVKSDGFYIPQRKWLFLWVDFNTVDVSIDGYVFSSDFKFQTLEQARNFVLNYKEKNLFEVIEYL